METLNSPRLHFNTGYHCAIADSERGKPRNLILKGEGNMRTVSRAFNPHFFDGYKKGLEHFGKGMQLETSAPAWKEFQAEKKAVKEKKKKDAEFAIEAWNDSKKRF